MDVPLIPGREIGGYRLEFRLGKGGMGEVWAASRTRSDLGFSKLIALKVLQGQGLTSNAAVMFLDEARAAGALHHPNIVPTVDLGKDGQTLFIAMELIRGPSLMTLLQRLLQDEKRMSPGVVAYLGLAISSALDYAHDRATHRGGPLRIIHRDVSPHNILLDVNGAIRLADFGVARSTVQDHESRVGTVRGKPSYMAPEQVTGERIDGRTDLFSLGIVLYECSCLQRLFGRGNATESMEAVLHGMPRPLPAFDPQFPDALWRVIARALEKDPGARFQNAAAMHDSIRRAAAGLEDFSAAGRALTRLIGETFEPDAFDTDAWPADARSVRRPRNGPPAARPEPPDIGPDDRRPTRGWPTVRRSEEPATEPEPRAAVLDRAPAVNAPRHPGPRPRPERRLARGTAALFLTAAAGLLAAATWVVARQETSARTVPGPTAAVTPATAGHNAPGVDPVPAPLASAARGPPKRSHRTAGRGPPAHAERPRDHAGLRRFTRFTVRRPGGPAQIAQPPAGVTDATFEEVRALLKRVRAVDPSRGSAMFVTFTEAGRRNTAMLNRLRRQARAVLREATCRSRPGAERCIP